VTLRRRFPGLILAGGFLAALVIRVLFFAALEVNWDSRWYAAVVAQLERGEDLFHGPTRYSYSPLWALFLRALNSVALPLGVPLHRAAGVVLFLADVGTALLVYAIARRTSKDTPMLASGAALLFFLNPVSVLATGFHNQFENVSILFLLLAVFCAGARPQRAHEMSRGQVLRAGTRRSSVIVAALSGSLLVKHITAFHPLLFLRSRRRDGLSVAAGLAPYVVFALSFVPYWRTRQQMVKNVFGYRSMSETYGTAVLTEHGLVPQWAPSALFLVAAAVGVLAFRRLEVGRASLLLFLVLLLFLPGIAEYYLIWPIALGAVYRGAGFFVYTTVVSTFFLGSPDGLAVPFEHFPGWHGVWFATLFWLLWEVRRVQGSRLKVQSESVA
jgi:hypothetical protein